MFNFAALETWYNTDHQTTLYVIVWLGQGAQTCISVCTLATVGNTVTCRQYLSGYGYSVCLWQSLVIILTCHNLIDCTFILLSSKTKAAYISPNAIISYPLYQHLCPPPFQAPDEEALLSAISTTVVSRIRESLDPNYPSSNIRDGYIICHTTATNTPTHRLTYRAQILATADISINRLLRLLQTWSSGSDSEFIIQHDMMLTTPLTTPILLLDPSCPVSVRTMAYPLCEAVDLSTSAGLESGCVSVPIFAASLVAVCLFLVVVTMVIVVCILVWSQGKKMK